MRMDKRRIARRVGFEKCLIPWKELKQLTLITNQILSSEIFPDSLKIAKVYPLFKRDNPKQLSNYRPISLLTSFSKIIEKVIYNQLYDFLNDNLLLSERQFGFRPR